SSESLPTPFSGRRRWRTRRRGRGRGRLPCRSCSTRSRRSCHSSVTNTTTACSTPSRLHGRRRKSHNHEVHEDHERRILTRRAFVTFVFFVVKGLFAKSANRAGSGCKAARIRLFLEIRARDERLREIRRVLDDRRDDEPC